MEGGGEGGEGTAEVVARGSAGWEEVVARGSEGGRWPGGRGGAKRALATPGKGAGGGGAS